MAIPLPPKQILLAVSGGVLMVAAAWILQPDRTEETSLAITSSGPSSISVARPVQRPYVDIVDTNADGVPDWQEALQNTEALTVSDAESTFVAPETLTDQFALEFFEQYMRGEQYGDFGMSPEELIAQSGELLANQATEQPITRSQVRTSTDTSPAALALYGEQVAAIIDRHSRTDTEQELAIIDRAIRLNSEAELAKLDPIITVYENILRDTRALAAPESYITEHLVLINAYQAILNDITAMRAAFDDPIRALLRVQRYEDDATGLNNAIVGLYDRLLAEGVTWGSNSPVFRLIEIR